jgi:sugar lactone lactonase YvrE
MSYIQTLLLKLVRAVIPGVILLTASATVLAEGRPLLNRFDTIDLVASTVPANGDENPYGIVVIPHSDGLLVGGNILISNFNNSQNLQGTGTTIVEVSPDGTVTLFAQIDSASLGNRCPGGVGLTTALVVLKRGWVIVGSLPTTDGTSATASAGCLIVLNSSGQVVETFMGNGINGPWDMTALDGEDQAVLFVTNVLNGDVTAGSPHIVNQGTVLRLALEVPKSGSGSPTLVSTTVVGSGFPETADPSALVIGPTGVGLGRDGTLYVADSLNNRVAAIPNAVARTTSAGTGTDVSVGGAINDPLGLLIAPNGDIIVANGGDGNLVEVTPQGNQVAAKTVEPTGAGTLFGIAIDNGARNLYFVDDGDNTLRVFTSAKNPGKNSKH